MRPAPRYNRAVSELVFLVEEAPEGGFIARALGAPVFTEADTLDELHAGGRHAGDQLGLPHATWLTFRRTYSSWSHDKGVPGKVVAQLMGHANVDTTLNVYTQMLDGSVRDAVEKIGGELFTIVHRPKESLR